MLFVFLKTSLPSDHGEAEANSFHSGQGGQLQPIMCVDKLVEELSTFTNLVTEAQAMGQEWQVVLVASMSGRNGVAPASNEADEPLKKMVMAVESGGDLSQFMAFDKMGTPLQFG